ncbi:Protein DJ-1 D, partial [Datura stramonium]|nr:Protein DJ-1 D [Datura stramonium]
VMFHLLPLAYGVAVDAVCPGKKAGDVCRTAIHQLSGHQSPADNNFALNATFDEIEAAKYDGLFITGGRAPEYLAMNESVLALVKSFVNTKKAIASICHGQLILAAADVAEVESAQLFLSWKPVLAAGAHWEEPKTMASCSVDGDLITASTYEGHPEFIRLFVKALGGSIVILVEVLHSLGMSCAIAHFGFMEDYEVMVPFQSLQALECLVDAVCPKKKAGEKCATAVHDFEGDQTYSEKPGHDFTLNANFESVDASSYDGLRFLEAELQNILPWMMLLLSWSRNLWSPKNQLHQSAMANRF